MGGQFTEAHVTDAKRICRGEQYLAARAFLRSRSTERAGPRILILSGGAPKEEVGVIRELWKGQFAAHITAIDVVEENVHRAIEAGADVGYVGNLITDDGHRTYNVQPELVRVAKFDLMHLDFCGLVDEEMRATVSCYSAHALTPNGVCIAAFSYGHDVPEFFLRRIRMGHFGGTAGTGTKALIRRGIPEAVCGRIAFLVQRSLAVESIVLYRGNAVPMCSVLLVKRRCPALQEHRGGSVKPSDLAEWPHNPDGDSSRISVAKIGDVDILEAVEQVNGSALYALPEERMGALRRSAAARKAVATRARAMRTNGAHGETT